MNVLETALEKKFPGYKALLTPRGGTALYLALQEIRASQGLGEIVLPSTVCPTVPWVVALAGFTLKFCDVEPETFCLSDRTIVPCLSKKTRAIIVVHLFGKSVELDKILELAHREQILVIEDIAQGIGGEVHGKPLGSFGDFSILSFSDSKIITGHGGALLVRNPNFWEQICKHYRELPAALDPDRLLELNRSFRNFTTGFYDLIRSCEEEDVPSLPPHILNGYLRMFIYRNSHSVQSLESITSQIDSLASERKRRYERYRIYQEYLNPRINYVRFSPDEMCWRLPLLAEKHDQQLRLLHNVRQKGYLISNHYFPASCLFGQSGLAASREIGMRALNLWVDSKVELETIPGICRLVNQSVS